MRIAPSEENVVGDYRLDVVNFGPIAKAGVDLRPLTVFIGPSNTGKSYLAILIYALHRCFGRQDGFVEGPLLRASVPLPQVWSVQSSTPSIRESLKEWLSKVSENEVLPKFPENLAASVQETLERPKSLEHVLGWEIRRCFGVDRLDELVRRVGAHPRTSVRMSLPQEADAGPIRYRLEFGQKGIHFSGQLPETFSLTSQSHLESAARRMWTGKLQSGKEDAEGQALDFIFRFLPGPIFASLLRPVSRNAYYLPADRTGVMHSHQVVVSTLIQNATTAGLRPSGDVPMLSGVLADFLSQLIEMSPQGRPVARHPSRESAHPLEALLEKNILQGRVRLERSETGYPTFAYRPEGWKADLPLMRASSMVSELAPVVLYLRHVVRPGDVLIIEEPEAHLHPAMQAAFARELARLVRAGVRIVMTTHSEWFLEQIGNLVGLSSLPEKQRTGIAGADVALRPDEVGAWLFKPTKRPKGSVVEEVPFNPETGLYRTDYDVVSEALYNESAAIFNRAQESTGG